MPTLALVAAVLVLAAGLRPQPERDRVGTSAPGGVVEEAATEAPEPLPVLRACIDAPPPCTSPSVVAAAGGGPGDAPILRDDGYRLSGYQADGTRLWSISLDDGAATSRGPDTGVLVAEQGGRIRLIDGNTGTVRWETALPFADDWVLQAAGDEDTIAVAAAPPTPDGEPRVIRVVGLSPRDGTVAWVHLANTRAPSLTATAAGDVIVLTGVLGDGVVSAIDTATGLLRWQADVGTPLRVLADQGQVLATSGGRLTLLDATTGRRALDVRTTQDVTALHSVSADGAVVDTQDGTVTVALPPS